jgi:hypothetical protein
MDLARPHAPSMTASTSDISTGVMRDTESAGFRAD